MKSDLTVENAMENVVRIRFVEPVAVGPAKYTNDLTESSEWEIDLQGPGETVRLRHFEDGKVTTTFVPFSNVAFMRCEPRAIAEGEGPPAAAPEPASADELVDAGYITAGEAREMLDLPPTGETVDANPAPVGLLPPPPPTLAELDDGATVKIASTPVHVATLTPTLPKKPKKKSKSKKSK